MTAIYLPGSAVATSRLGFGCAYLTGGFEMRANCRLVDAAFDAGFRHFDVAPLYGIGTAEDVLARALSSRRGQVTLASKVGRPRPHLSMKTQFLRFFAAPLRRYAAAYLRRRVQQATAGMESRGRFDLPFVEQSVAETFRRLRTDYLDLLLLHEAALEDISDELLTFLDKGRQSGRFRSLGIASTYDKILRISPVHGDFFDVLQYSWSVLDVGQQPLPGPAFRVTHRAIMRAYDPLQDWLRSDPDVAERLSNAVNCDLLAPGAMSNLLLGAALAHNPGGIALVGTRRIDRIAENAAVLGSDTFIRQGRALAEALVREQKCPSPV